MKTARIAIFLTGLIGLGMGGLMSLSSIQSQQEEAVIRTNESLKTQAQAYVDQFFGAIDNVRSGGNPNYVLNSYTVKLVQGIPAEVEKSAKDTPAVNSNVVNAANTVNNLPQNVDLALEERLITALKNQVSLTDLQLSKYSVGTYETTDLGSKEGIFVAVPTEVNPVTKAISKINVTLIDPTLALTSLPKLITSKLDRNAYLINKNGKVLAHTSSAYVGTDLRKTEGLRTSIENLFVGAQTGLISNYHSVDGTKEQVAFIRAGTLPFAIAVEQRAIPSVLSIAWAEDQFSSGAARKALGMIFLVMAASLVLFSAVTYTFNRRIQEELKLTKFQTRYQGGSQKETNENNSVPVFNNNINSNSNVNYVTEPKIQHAVETFSTSRNQIESETRGTSESSSILADLKATAAAQTSFHNSQFNPHANQTNTAGGKITVHRDYGEELAARVKTSTTPEEIEKTLAQLTSEMSESATLFFRYNRRLQNLTLGTVAGAIQIQNTALFQAYIRKDIEEQVEGFATEGKIASLNNYGPVSKMMIAHLNVAHFEAWAVTSEADVSGTPKLLGVLVVLNAGFRSAQSRPVLSRMLKEAGNYLYAHTNKITNNRNRSIRPPAAPISNELNS